MRKTTTQLGYKPEEIIGERARAHSARIDELQNTDTLPLRAIILPSKDQTLASSPETEVIPAIQTPKRAFPPLVTYCKRILLALGQSVQHLIFGDPDAWLL